MLFRTSTLRSRLALCAASVAVAAGVAASPAEAGSKQKLWLKQEGSAVFPGNQGRPQGKPGRDQPPAQVRAGPPPWPRQTAVPSQNAEGDRRGHQSRYTPPAPPPQAALPGKRGAYQPRYTPPAPPPQAALPGKRGAYQPRYTPPAPPPQAALLGKRGAYQPRYTPPPPALADRDRRRDRNPGYIPPPPPPGAASDGRHGHGNDHGQQHHDGNPNSKNKHRHHETHVTHHHVYRHYYYRTSARHYYYYYGVPQPYPYPVYYLVPYHVHTSPGYYNHGEQTNYCSDGYAQGGVYTGGAYTRGASHQPGATILGGILGAVAGAQVGNGKGQLVAVGVGTVIGALIGSDVGRAMDERDRAYATGSFGYAMETAPTCTTITWNNQQTGNYGSVTPVQTYEPEPGRYCREFQQQVMIGGTLQDAYGTACRQPDGSWEIIAEQP